MNIFKRTVAAVVPHHVESVPESIGKWLLRLTVAGLMLFHGIDKLINGIGGIQQMLESSSLPPQMAYGVYIGELVVPILIIVGFLTRISALIFAFNMLVAIGLAHLGDFGKIGGHGEWAVELPMFYLLGAICIALLGPGRYALGYKTGPLA